MWRDSATRAMGRRGRGDGATTTALADVVDAVRERERGARRRESAANEWIWGNGRTKTDDDATTRRRGRRWRGATRGIDRCVCRSRRAWGAWRRTRRIRRGRMRRGRSRERCARRRRRRRRREDAKEAR